jgi:hypothetical protein
MAVRLLKDPTTWVNDQIAGVRNSLDKYRDGVQNPSRDPKQAMEAAKDRYKDSVSRSLSEDRWAKSISNIDFDEAAALAVASADKLASGVEARKTKITRRVTKLHGFLTAHVQAMNAMPVKSDADAEKKMLANLKGMRDIGAKMRG